MKILQWTLAVVGIFALAIVGAGFFLPSKFEVSRSVVINAPAEKVYDLVADPRQWKSWSAWHARDPKMDLTYSGPPFGQGAKWAWKSASEGAGQMEFTRVEPNRRVEYSLVFAEFGMRSAGAFFLEPSPAGSKITWTNGGDVGTNPLKHYLAWGMDRLVGPDFEQGLANLKAVAEKP
ncbi:MAG TPA: SRPBCC family protein [Usitatibacter sp.]|nr:SRPBCC family protein [Usitatibacter sp.]